MTDRTAAIRLIAVGDLQLGDSATCVGFGFRSRVTDRALRSALERLVSVIGRSDVGFANLETPLSDLGLDSRRRQSRQLRGAPSYAQVLRCGGFSVVNVANNHALEHGPEVFRDSVSRVEATGVTICGRRGSAGWSSEPAVKIVRDLRIGFLGYSLRPSQAAVDVRPHAEATVEQIGRGPAVQAAVSLHQWAVSLRQWAIDTFLSDRIFS